MSLKLDDLIGKKKEVVQILDLSKATANNAEELKKVMEKVPDFKMKPEKVRAEDVKVQDRPRRWRRRPKKTGYPFADPVPAEMRSLRLEDLCSVPIQWNMLTTLRPKAKVDEEYFSRLVELGKLELSTREKERRGPDLLRRGRGRETRFPSCLECGEDFCQREVCYLLQYDNFKRQAIPETVGKKENGERGRGKGKRRGKSRVRKSRSRARSKSGNRSASRSKRSKSRGRTKSRSKSSGRSKSGERSKSGRRDPSGERIAKSSRKKKTPSKPRKGSKSAARKPKKKPSD